MDRCLFEECVDTAGRVREDHTQTTDSAGQQLGLGRG